MVSPTQDFCLAPHGRERPPRCVGGHQPSGAPAKIWPGRPLGRIPLWVRLCPWMVGLGLLLSLSRPARAAFELGENGWEGASELLSLARERLGSARVEPVARLDYSALTPKDGVLVLHPESELDGEQVSAFLAAG